MALVPMVSDQSIQQKLVDYSNPNAATIPANSSANITLSTSDNDLSGWTAVGVLNYNLRSGDTGALALKALSVGASSNITAVIINASSSSITINATKCTASVRMLKL